MLAPPLQCSSIFLVLVHCVNSLLPRHGLRILAGFPFTLLLYIDSYNYTAHTHIMHADSAELQAEYGQARDQACAERSYSTRRGSSSEVYRQKNVTVYA